MRSVIAIAVTVTAGALAAAAFASADGGASASVPFKGNDSFASTVVGGSGSVVQTADTGSGYATHLGRFTMVASETVDFATLDVTSGAYTLTAANSDTVSGTYSGHILPGLTGYLVSGPITGGTGRFAGVIGVIVFDGSFDPATFIGSDDISGTISSVGSIPTTDQED